VNREEFDQLYRSHLANVYRFLNLMPPEELSRPILRVAVQAVQIAPSGGISPTIDGEVTSYFEWMGAGIYRVDERSGSMHGKKFLVKEVQFGSDGAHLFVRVDFHQGYEQELLAMEVRFTAIGIDSGRSSELTIAFPRGAAKAEGIESVECALGRVLEIKIPLGSIGVTAGRGVRFQMSIWESGLPMDAVPQQGLIEMASTDPQTLEG